VGYKKAVAFIFSKPELGCQPLPYPGSYLCHIVLSGAIPKISTLGLPHDIAAIGALLGFPVVAFRVWSAQEHEVTPNEWIP
jgi:hypothetical protein